MRHPLWIQYVLAVIAVAAALGLKLLLVPLLTQEVPFQLLFLAVMVAAWFGGLGPGLLAMTLAAIFDNYFFAAPFYDFGFAAPGSAARLTLFLIEGICISVICAKLRAARQRVEDTAEEARNLERKILEISDAEQRRIGHDLHDGLGQHLTGIALMTEQLEQRLQQEGSAHAPRVAKISGLAAKAVEWTHDLTRSLSPPALDTSGLPGALSELAANAENIFGIRCAFRHDTPTPTCDVAAGVHLYRIAQEAISNAVKHGNAENVSIALSQMEGAICMRIEDDGAGIQPDAGLHDGMGLRIMRYRANMIGANISVRHTNGRNSGGTVILCHYRPPANRG